VVLLGREQRRPVHDHVDRLVVVGGVDEKTLTVAGWRIVAARQIGPGRVKEFCAQHLGRGNYFPGCPAQVR